MNSTTIGWSNARVSFTVQFWILLIFSLVSLICSLIIIYRYLSNSTKRQALHNHSILLLIFLNVLFIFTDVSWMLDGFRRQGSVSFHRPVFCLIWWFCDFTLYSIQTVLLAWASIERHLLIFHSKFVTTQHQRILYHYFPPMVLIAIFNLALLYRIIKQKQRLRQPIQWRKHRRMAVQLLSISAVYVFVNLPSMILLLSNYYTTKKTYETNLYVFISTYLVTLFFY